MKHLLFTLLLLSAVSCKKMNHTSGALNLPLDGKSYLSVPHTGSTLLRFKVLNLALREILHDQTDLTEIEKISSGEELNELKLTKKELEDYRRIRSNQAEIVVSYNNRVDIYFAPDGVSKEALIDKLAILSEDGSRLYWAQGAESKLEKGRVYYIVNSTMGEIMSNDFRFHTRQENLGEIKNNFVMNFSRYQKVRLSLDVSLIQKDLGVVEIRGVKKHCTTELNESQLCEPCSFKIQRLTGKELELPEKNVDFVSLKINEKEMTLNELGAVKLKNNEWELYLDFEKLIDQSQGHDVRLELFFKKESPRIVRMSGYDYSENCQNRDYVEIADLTLRRSIEMRAQIAGRNLEIESFEE